MIQWKALGSMHAPAAPAQQPVTVDSIAARLAFGGDVTIAVASDSTADNLPPVNDQTVVEWPRLICDKVAQRFPKARVRLHEWSDATSAWAAPTIVQAGIPLTSGGIIQSDGFERTATNVVGTVGDVPGFTWEGNGTVPANGTSVTLPQYGALSAQTPVQDGSHVTDSVSIKTNNTATQQVRLGVCYTNAGLTGFGIYGMLQFNAGGIPYIGIRKTTNVGPSNTEVVPLSRNDTLGFTPGNATRVQTTLALKLEGETVTFTVTVGETVTTITGTVPMTEIDALGYYSGIMQWTAASDSFVHESLLIRTDATPDNYPTFDLYNGSRAGTRLDYQAGRAGAMYGATSPDMIVVSSGLNATYTPQFFRNFTREHLNTIRAAAPGAKVVLASQNPRYSPPMAAWQVQHHQARMGVLQPLATELGVEYLPVFERFSAAPGGLTSDGTHPNNAGSQLWADILWGRMFGSD